NVREVKVLREFRKNVLLKNELGIAFVDAYNSGTGKKVAYYLRDELPSLIPVVRKGLDFLVEIYSRRTKLESKDL
ncbi:MAG: hypothetical protein AABX59_01255, partial [Nanoarchaeota archaeon]